MILLALASLFSAPTPLGPYPWFSNDDVPASVRHNYEPYSVLIRTIVDPNGALQGCEIERSSPNNGLDAYTCSLVLKRAKLKPARWVDGSPAVGVHRSKLVWTTSRANSPESYSDFTLQVDRLPKGLRSPAWLEIMFTADDKGAPLACGTQKKTDNPALIELACGEFVKGFVATPPKSASGVPVRSVQNAFIQLVKR